MFSQNFEAMGVDRAGAMANVSVPNERSAPCTRPFETMTIAFDGRVFPCCQFYPDLPENGRYAIGGLDDCSEAMAGWRRALFRYGPKGSPCNTCPEADVPGAPDEIAAREALAEGLGVCAPGAMPQHWINECL